MSATRRRFSNPRDNGDGEGGTCSYHQLRRSSLFSLYARIFRLLLSKWERSIAARGDGLDVTGDCEEDGEVDEYDRELDKLVLPSNEEWRLRVYYRLVELQREEDHSAAAEEEQPSEEISMNELTRLPTGKEVGVRRRRDFWRTKKWEWEPDDRVTYPVTPRSGHRGGKGPGASFDSSASSVILEAGVEPGWRLRDILLAAQLLEEQEEDEVNYSDESEMRRVFGLIYDVLRYKQILDRALEDVGFWVHHSKLKPRQRVVWLLLYDMQGRKFARAGTTSEMEVRREALREAGLFDVERALVEMKTRLAASLTRMRIGGSALNLDELLPAHLRTAEGVTWGNDGAIASGWVNSSKLPSRRQFVDEMRKLGLSLCVGCMAASQLEEDQYVFDPLCPKVINIHEKAREKLAMSHLVRSHAFIFLERSLCVGAAALVQAMRAGRLCGPVILTHSLAPRHTGYLAELLVDVDDAGRLLAFGLGEKRGKHQAYLDKLGISNNRCRLFSESYTSPPPSLEIERATIVLATPPCSYTGVRDVVDFAVARDGDLQLLDTLTSQDAESTKQPLDLLAEQMATLRHALTRPNVQLLVYEVHTLLPAETSEMIDQAVDHANKMAFDKFTRDHPQRKKSPPREPIGKKSKPSKRSQSSDQISKASQEESRGTLGSKATQESKTTLESEDETSRNDISIPDSDLFEITQLSELYGKECQKLLDQGSYVIVAKRKEMMQFNSKFMIKVAESKGVFGEPTNPCLRPVKPDLQRPAAAVQPPETVSCQSRRKRGKIQFERITAPTHASIMRALRVRQPCPRHQQHICHEESSVESQVREARRRDARRWWDELARFWRRGSSHADDYRFHALRTDPLTQKILFPSHVILITYAESRRPSSVVVP